jgi:NAD(P)-dependent dehydrogenase (short-subunit alcohol dehydrogenase family)
VIWALPYDVVTKIIERLFGVEGKVAVVTGGSSGIGLMIATGFVEAGARVYIASRKADVCAQVAADLSKVGECFAIAADLSTEAGARGLADSIAEREPAVHILVNNAGATWGAPLEEFPDDGLDRSWDLNVKGVFHLSRFLLPQLRAAATADDPARIINIGSIDGIRVPVTNAYGYGASKAALNMMSRHMATHLAAENVAVNVIAPGPFESRMMHFALGTPEGMQAVARTVPLGRVGRPDDMAGAALFLASRAGAYLTGTVIPVDGGIQA